MGCFVDAAMVGFREGRVGSPSSWMEHFASFLHKLWGAGSLQSTFSICGSFAEVPFRGLQRVLVEARLSGGNMCFAMGCWPGPSNNPRTGWIRSF